MVNEISTLPTALARKLIEPTELTERFGRPRRYRLVFTNGCFDLLHRGHVDYLTRARELGDALVVGLNSDASVRRLKGPERPINSQDDRAIVLAGLAAVDGVVIFDEETPIELIRALLPDVLVKGGDYVEEAVVGAREVRAAGGEVVLAPLVPGRSTTALVHRLAAEPRT